VIYVKCLDSDKELLGKVEATLDAETTLSAWIRTVIREAAGRRLTGA
jgi:hypothetical protein